MKYRIVGVSGSPVKDGNVDAFLEAIMEHPANDGMATEIINLAELTVKDCIHCNFCLTKQKTNRYCALTDDAQTVFERLEGTDIIVLASPVYFMRTSGLMATLIDRLRVFIFGNIAGGRLRNNVDLSAAVSWLRHGGAWRPPIFHIC